MDGRSHTCPQWAPNQALLQTHQELPWFQGAHDCTTPAPLCRATPHCGHQTQGSHSCVDAQELTAGRENETEKTCTNLLKEQATKASSDLHFRTFIMAGYEPEQHSIKALPLDALKEASYKLSPSYRIWCYWDLLHLNSGTLHMTRTAKVFSWSTRDTNHSQHFPNQ